MSRGNAASVAFGLAALLAAALLAYPIRHGAPYLDDFVFLTLGSHLEQPMALLTQDSLGTFFFRPLVMFLWWVSVRILGVDAGAHAMLNVALHAANGVLLFALMRRLRISPAPAAAVALAFIVHPAGFATAAWLSDRFDLFATLFGLLALLAAQAFLQRPGIARLAVLLAWLAAALLSKELAFAFVAAALLMLAWPGSGAAAQSRGWRLAGFAGMALVVLLDLGARALVLRSASDYLLKDGLLFVLADGVSQWMSFLPSFFIVWQGNALATAIWIAALAAIASASLVPGARAAWRQSTLLRIVAIGLAIALVAILAQAPVVRASVIQTFQGEAFNFEAVAASRFYYVPFAGLALALGALGETLAAALRGAALAARRGAIAAVAATLVALLVTSRGIGRELREFIRSDNAVIARAATDVVAALGPLEPGCKIYLIGTLPANGGFRTYVDALVKSALPPRHPALECFILTEHTPWYNLVESRRLPPGAERPLETVRFEGHPYPPLKIGNLSYYYLNVTERSGAPADPRAAFFAYEGERFADVTADVRSGRRPVRFFVNRREK